MNLQLALLPRRISIVPMKLIPINRGRFVIVDDEDYDRMMERRWTAVGPKGYAFRQTGPRASRKNVWMHRVICNPPEGMDVDHINMDRLDNRRENLRPATRSQNFFNKGKQSNNHSGHKGVFWEKSCDRWRVQIKANGIRRHIGVFRDIADAVAAYAKAAAEFHGEFARVA